MPTKDKKDNSRQLTNNIAVDVAIIGAGLAGISTAYFLSKSGKSVAVLEANTVGAGATSKTTAFITQVIDTSLADLASIFGEDKTKLIWQSHGHAIKTIEQIVNSENIDCAFTHCPSYYYANSKKEFEDLEKDYQVAKNLGLNIELRATNNLPFRNFGYLEITDQAKFDARKYVQGLAKAAKNYGARIFENTAVNKISHPYEAAWELSTKERSTITAKDAIITTYYPFDNPEATLFKKGMYVSYVLVLNIPPDTIPEAIYEDTANPYNYFRIDKAGKNDIMTIGGQDHRAEIKMDARKNYKAIEECIKQTFPDLKHQITSRWTGPILEPSDGMALIGETLAHQFVATAFSGNGMTYSTIAGMLLCDILSDKANPWQGLYNPKRIPSLKQLAIKGRDYTEELFSGAIKNAFK